ncbi:hypothetical protein ABBQ32_005118 [Trebouxia sp. C0010 RCD-2024]
MASHRLSETYRQSKGGNTATGINRKQSTCKQGQACTVGSKEGNHDEWVLRQFDLAAKYGPCTNISRKERWERASLLGLDPPQAVLHILQQPEVEQQEQQGLWANRI